MIDEVRSLDRRDSVKPLISSTRLSRQRYFITTYCIENRGAFGCRFQLRCNIAIRPTENVSSSHVPWKLQAHAPASNKADLKLQGRRKRFLKSM